jgi:hypothetical protein
MDGKAAQAIERADDRLEMLTDAELLRGRRWRIARTRSRTELPKNLL